LTGQSEESLGKFQSKCVGSYQEMEHRYSYNTTDHPKTIVGLNNSITIVNIFEITTMFKFE